MTTQLSRLANTDPVAPAHREAALASQSDMTLNEVWWLAEKIASGRLFACQTAAEAFCLMMLAQSEGLHPMQAVKRYHIIEGRPSMRADAMQAEFQARGGKITILRNDEEAASAEFSHPVYHADPVAFTVTWDDIQRRGIHKAKDGSIKKNWAQSRSDMLWARLVTRAIRKIYPGIVVGIYTPEEIEDLLEDERPRVGRERPRAELETPGPSAENIDEVRLPGQRDDGFDPRTYREVVSDAARAVNAELTQIDPNGIPLKVAEIHRHLGLRAINAGHHVGRPPATANAAVPILAGVYREQRAWLRMELAQFLMGLVEEARKKAELGADAEHEPGAPDGDLPAEPGMNG